MADTQQAPAAIPAGFVKNAVGHLVPEHQVREHDKLRDSVARDLSTLALHINKALTQFKAKALGESASDHLDSFNYGAGAEYRLSEQNGVRADWTRRDFRDGDGKADAYTLSFVRRF